MPSGLYAKDARPQFKVSKSLQGSTMWSVERKDFKVDDNSLDERN